ncbi:signal peptidase I [Peptococcaceae bacterium]|nr:signal peptidase I [Peptococcaceae bacterium]
MSDLESKTLDKNIQSSKKSLIRETVESILIAAVLAMIIRLFVIEPFYIPSGSMEPTLMVNDRIIVSKISYYFEEPERGDVVVFKYPKDTSRNFVKRLIAKPGETVELKNSKLYINGKFLPESYLPADLIYPDYGPVTVPEDHYFMLGDNRNSSEDSRFWGFMHKDLIIGKAVIIYWPPNRIGLIE